MVKAESCLLEGLSSSELYFWDVSVGDVVELTEALEKGLPLFCLQGEVGLQQGGSPGNFSKRLVFHIPSDERSKMVSCVYKPHTGFDPTEFFTFVQPVSLEFIDEAKMWARKQQRSDAGVDDVRMLPAEYFRSVC